MIPPPPRSTLFPYTTLFRSLLAPWEMIRDYDTWMSQSICNRMRLSRWWKEHLLGSLLAEYVDRSGVIADRSEEHTSELQSRFDLVCRLLLEKKKKIEQELNG